MMLVLLAAIALVIYWIKDGSIFPHVVVGVPVIIAAVFALVITWFATFGDPLKNWNP